VRLSFLALLVRGSVVEPIATEPECAAERKAAEGQPQSRRWREKRCAWANAASSAYCTLKR